MPRDIDFILSEVVKAIPDCGWSQLDVLHPGDDDGLWFVGLSNDKRWINLESSQGMVPFLVEYDSERVTIDNSSEIVELVIRVLTEWQSDLPAKECGES